MNEFLLAPAACTDLDEIWSYHGVDLQNVDLADRIRDEIFEAFRLLAKTPGLGHSRSDLASEPLRFWAVRSYLIIYRGETRPIEIVRVLHGARDVKGILGRQTARKRNKR